MKSTDPEYVEAEALYQATLAEEKLKNTPPDIARLIAAGYLHRIRGGNAVAVTTAASCACGRTFAEMEWAALPLAKHGYSDVSFDQTECRPPCAAQYAVGEQNHAADCESRSYTLEYRNCECGSTLVRRRPIGWRPCSDQAKAIARTLHGKDGSPE